MRLIFLASLAILACASVPTKSRTHYEVAVLPLADNALDFLYYAIAERGRLEAWFCLRGFVDHGNRSAIVMNISPVFVDSADRSNIHGRPRGCAHGTDSASVIGTVHFHPDPGQCEFSDIDIVTAYNLPYQVEAIMCREDRNSRPELRAVFRPQIDSAYRALRPAADSEPPRTFKAVYRYVRPDPKENR